jgi:hypothetical protein
MASSRILKLILESRSNTFFWLITGIIVICNSSTDVYAQRIKLKKKTNTIKYDSIRKDTSKVSKLYERNLNEVIITSQRKEGNITNTIMGIQKFTSVEIKKVPALMGEIDVIKAMQLLPGVQSTSEGSSGFNVRGGAADQNLILLDNTNIYNASHMFGFFSIFNNDAVKSAELYKGNLPIKYGGRLSSLLNVDLKDDSPEKITGTGGIGLISSRLTIEGPLGDKTSWLVSGRRSYADLFLRMSSDPEKQKEYLYFYDLNAKITHRFSRKDKIGFNLYNGRDRFISSFGDIGYGNFIASAFWNHLFSENLLSRLSLNYSKYSYDLLWKVTDSRAEWESDIQDLELRLDMNHTLTDKINLQYGATTTYHAFNPAYITRPGYPDFRMNRSYALEHNIYLGVEQNLSKTVSVTYGARITVFRNLGKTLVYSYDNNYEVSDAREYGSGKVYHTYIRPEFRAGAVYKVNESSSIKANFTHNTQFIQMANNSDSGSPLDLWFPASPNIKPQEANQYSIGYFRNFKNNMIETSVEFYYKGINNVIDFKDNAQILLNDKLEREIRTGKGKSYGMEVMVKKNSGRLTGFINYTLAHTDRTIPGINDGKTYLAPNDKTHSVNILASYTLSKKWDVSAEWVFSTGTPVTYPTGRFEVNGEYYPIYSGKSKERKEPYHRLDISATYHPYKHPQRWYQGEWVFSVYNVYWHKNPWMTSFDQNTTDGYPQAKMTYLFGAIPSVTYNFKF